MSNASVDASLMFPIEDDGFEELFGYIENCRELATALQEREWVLAEALCRIAKAGTIEDAVAVAADTLAELGIVDHTEEGRGKGDASA